MKKLSELEMIEWKSYILNVHYFTIHIKCFWSIVVVLNSSIYTYINTRYNIIFGYLELIICWAELHLEIKLELLQGFNF